MDVHDKAAHAKHISPLLAGINIQVRNQALEHIIQVLKTHHDEIARANQHDLEQAKMAALDAPLLKRLVFDSAKLQELVATYESLIQLPDPIGRMLEARELDEGLILQRSTCPIGVIAMIFESRPDALVQIAGLCLKSGNAVLLKGGREARETNRVLAGLIHDAACACGFPSGWLVNLESREEVGQLLGLHDYVDLVIPRGSNAFVQHIMANSRIPVMGHADGICHVYVDQEAEQGMAMAVVADSKTQYVAVCNAAETLLVHAAAAPVLLPAIGRELTGRQVELRCCPKSLEILRQAGIPASANPDQDWAREYLDYVMGVKVVDNLEAAIDHINHYGSHHTDSIVTANQATAEQFMSLVDSASVFWNASTRFADGFRYGLGAEVGVSTGKLHARGPVGMEGLLTYKWKLRGKGHLVADYARGNRHFTHRDLPVD